MLAARLDAPDGPIRAYALFAHCFTCGKDVFAASRIAQALTAHGIAVLRFDFTGLGASEGDFANTNFSSNIADLAAAADYLRSTRAAPQLLIGHSLGGAATLAVAASIPEARAVVTIAAPRPAIRRTSPTCSPASWTRSPPTAKPRCNWPGGRSASRSSSWTTWHNTRCSRRSRPCARPCW